MIEFINCQTGSLMYVHESRKDEYIAAGHKLSCNSVSGNDGTKGRKTTARKASRSKKEQ